MAIAMQEAVKQFNAAHEKKNIDVDRLRTHLEQNNGIPDLNIVDSGDTETALAQFRKDGFVVIRDVLTKEQIDILAKGCQQVAGKILAADREETGTRGSGRYSFGGSSNTRSQLHRPEWQMLLDVDEIHVMLETIFGSDDYILRAASGDFCLPGTTAYQPLHSDVGEWKGKGLSNFSSFHDPSGSISIRDLPTPYICVNFLPQDVTSLNGPTCQIPGSQNSRAEIPKLDDTPEWMRLSTVCPAPAGSIMIRDVRGWHGGTPNLSDNMRSIPNLEFYAPWFREPMVPGISYSDHKKLSERSQRLTRYSVQDSSEDLDTSTVLFAP